MCMDKLFLVGIGIELDMVFVDCRNTREREAKSCSTVSKHMFFVSKLINTYRYEVS